jgi:hypothetical protein
LALIGGFEILTSFFALFHSIVQAQDALDALKKDSITEVRSYTKPLPAVEKVLATVMIILGKDTSWASAKKEMGDASFLQRLKTLKPDDVSNNVRFVSQLIFLKSFVLDILILIIVPTDDTYRP